LLMSVKRTSCAFCHWQLPPIYFNTLSWSHKNSLQQAAIFFTRNNQINYLLF
jgi:hypothetical protein